MSALTRAPAALGASSRLNFEKLASATYAPGSHTKPRTLTDLLRTIPTPTTTDAWCTTSALGRIVVTPDDRPIRTIITGRKRLVTGSYASRKARRAQPYESMIELAFFHFSEVDTAVVDYRAQPFRFEFTLDGVQRTYIADCARVLADGSAEVVELKSDDRALKDPDYSAKLNAVGQLCEALGWRFRVVLKAHLEEPRLLRQNVRLVQSQRTVQFDTGHFQVASDLLDRQGEVRLAELASSLGDRRTGEAIIMAMMVGRLVEIDLTSKLCGASFVRPVPSTHSHTLEGARL